ncbi:SLAP domain-containing protein [Lactobacillus sp. ESL0681]|uniref:SLAP domain-containing protein n=1 Tax=Lactobacillus sp. ESL0681 TaxID=2983211 RepID=UPI0023FA33BE|nr:SLAP domain-containing protein [Lactobacillus sp. ESL0681]WEV39623.1 SLAP domain-containing protein [Lactobacillus sp. ESL0681]
MKEKKLRNCLKLAFCSCLLFFSYIANTNRPVFAADTTDSAAEIDYDAITPVAQPKGQEVVIPTNTKITQNDDYARLSLANWQDMPAGTTFSWIRKPKTIINGLSDGRVGIVLPDGTFKFVEVTVKIAGQKQVKLKKDTYLFNEQGKQLNKTLLKSGSIVNVNGTKKIKGHKFYVLDDQHFLSLSNFKVSKKQQVKVGKKLQRVMHSTYLYDEKGHRANAITLKAGSYVKIHEIAQEDNINYAAGRFFYLVGKGLYVPVRNITGMKNEVEWQDKAIPLYNNKGKRIGEIPAHTPYRTYGDAVKIKDKYYYIVDKGKLIRDRVS